MIAIITNNLTKQYKEKTAVKDLNISVEEGTLYAFLGLNGAGKTTTIKMLTGLIKPTSGTAKILSYDLNTNIDDIKKITSISPQDSALALKLTVFENIEMMALIYGLAKKDALEKTNGLIKEFSLEEYKNKKCSTLSGGFQRRVSIAMALVSEPKILFLDEPTLGLDVLARRDMWNVIKDLKKKMTIILTTHYLEEAQNLADTIGVISNGQLLFQGNLVEIYNITKTNNLEDAFVKLCGGNKDE